MEFDELSTEQKAEYWAGYHAAFRGEPFWELNTVEWMIGFRDYWKDKASEAQKATCTVH